VWTFLITISDAKPYKSQYKVDINGSQKYEPEAYDTRHQMTTEHQKTPNTNESIGHQLKPYSTSTSVTLYESKIYKTRPYQSLETFFSSSTVYNTKPTTYKPYEPVPFIQKPNLET
jgi:hypothetical protein